MVENLSRMFNSGIVEAGKRKSNFNIFQPKGNIRKIFARFGNYVTGQSNGFAEGLNINIFRTECSQHSGTSESRESINFTVIYLQQLLMFTPRFRLSFPEKNHEFVVLKLL